jgi:hypothetical protein
MNKTSEDMNPHLLSVRLLKVQAHTPAATLRRLLVTHTEHVSGPVHECRILKQAYRTYLQISLCIYRETLRREVLPLFNQW